jgi:hypothetical protein
MKLTRKISILLVCICAAVAIAARAQNQNQNQHKQQNKKQAHGKTAQHARQARPAQRGRTAQRSARTQTRQRTTRTTRTPVRRTSSMARSRMAGNARGGRPARYAHYNGRVPYARFHASFGSAHRFHVSHFMMVGGRRQFVYGGYRFAIVGAWPMGWAYTSPFYIDWIDGGYFMFNPLYPGIRVAIIVL